VEKEDGSSDLAARVESLNAERGAFEEQSQKYKVAIGAQKRYIGKRHPKSKANKERLDSLNEALRLSDETRLKLKEEVLKLFLILTLTLKF